jgi:hypothetical protein
MTEVSPSGPEQVNAEQGRTLATGALRRVFKSREKARNKNRLGLRLNAEEDGSELESDDSRVLPHTQNTSNHYTLNLPSAPAPRSETPYILLGYVAG